MAFSNPGKAPVIQSRGVFGLDLQCLGIVGDSAIVVALIGPGNAPVIISFKIPADQFNSGRKASIAISYC